MIQRIQSIHLFLACILLALVFFFPLAGALVADGSEIVIRVKDYPILMVFVSGALAFSFSSIFFFKKRMLQIRLNIFSLLLILTTIGFMAYYFWVSNITYTAITPKAAFVFPVVALIFIIFAMLGIRKDEKIIQSLKRIR